MRDILETPRLGLAAVTAAATLVGLTVGWGLSTLIREEREVSAINDLPELAVPEESEHSSLEDLDYAAMLEAFAAAGIRIIPESLLERLDAPAVGADGRLTEPLVDALLLSEAETEQLNRALAETEIRLRMIELDRLQVVERSADRLVIRIEAYRDEGVGVERMLRERIAATIGQIDGELFWNLMTREMPGTGMDHWGGFGREPVAAVFEREIIDEDDNGQTVEIRFGLFPLEPEAGETEIARGEEADGVIRLRVGEGSSPPDNAWVMLDLLFRVLHWALFPYARQRSRKL